MRKTLIDKTLPKVLAVLDGADRQQGQPFSTPAKLVPHTDSRFYGWTHYGVMIPDLPDPHRFFSIMSVIGTPGALAFDTDHALVASPRGNATVVSGTAATHPRHFAGYSIARDCDMAADGSRIRFGQEVDISGSYPHYRVQARWDDFALDIELTCTDKVSWFAHNPIYDHLSLLAHYRGTVRLGTDRMDIAGPCTFEHAACVSPYLLRDRPLPERLKLPLNFFTYQIINFPDGVQLLMTQVMVLGRPIITAAYLRSNDSYSRTLRDASFEVLEYQPEPARAPDGKLMRLPQVFRWRVRDAGRVVLDLTGTVDTPMTYGLGSGYVGGYRYEGLRDGVPVSGPGYIEFIDRRG